jgi:hypothetical protein
MIVALIDNGSLEPAAHRQLRAVAAVLAERVGVPVHAVSWKHSDRIAADALDGTRAWTLAPFLRAQLARGERELLFVPFFISAQGAIGSALRGELEGLRRELGVFLFAFTEGLAARGALAPILAGRVRESIAAKNLVRPPVIVVDHGGPSAESAALRDAIAREIGATAAASMEGAHAPLLADELRRPDYADRDVVLALLFLAPGRHAGPAGDVARICAASGARCHPTEPIGTHPRVIEEFAGALRHALSQPASPALA